MILEIFDVEHGACALLTTSNGRRIMIDCGDNTSTGWAPGRMLRQRNINVLDKLIVTNYDEDHVSGFESLRDNVFIGVLQRNTTVTPQALRHLKSDDGMGSGIAALTQAIENVFTGGPPSPQENDYGDTLITAYQNRYAVLPVQSSFNDENNLSLVVFVHCRNHKIIFPGDMEKAGWKALLGDPGFRAELAGVTLFVASHHGRENGYCQEVLDLCPRVRAFIISDKKTGFQSQETVPQYRAYATGFDYGGETRRVLTTRRDGNIRVDFGPTGNATVLLGYAA